MRNMTAREILQAARDHLSSSDNWCRMDLCDDCGRHCVLGALVYVALGPDVLRGHLYRYPDEYTDYPALVKAHEHLAAVRRFPPEVVNDIGSHANVLEMLDEAIEHAK